MSEPPARIVSLVPSMTETLFALDVGEKVVGITEFCVHPAAGVASKVRVGGTKNPSIERILELRPDLVLANREENRRRDVERLEASGVRVFVTYPRTVREAIADIRTLGNLVDRVERTEILTRAVEEALERAQRCVPDPRPRVVALIWKKPYMAVGGATFGHDLIVQSGGENLLADAPRRYPRLDEDELRSLRPDVILLPTEPYAFAEQDRLELLRLPCPAALDGRVHIVEGELLSWYGPRMARALDEFSLLLRG